MSPETFFKARKIFKKMKRYYELKEHLKQNKRSSFTKDGVYMSNASAIEWAERKIVKLANKLEKL